MPEIEPCMTHSGGDHLISWAWSIIANGIPLADGHLDPDAGRRAAAAAGIEIGPGDWRRESGEWKEAALKWRDAFHEWLDDQREYVSADTPEVEDRRE